MPRKASPWFRTATGRWYVLINSKQTALPVTDPKDEGAAWAAFRELVAQALPAKKQGRKEPASVLVPEYLNAIAHKINPRTRKGYESYLRHFLARFGDQCIDQIDPDSVEKSALENGWSDSNRNNYLWAVQAFVRWAGRKDFTLSRPAKESRGADAVIAPEVHKDVLRETTGDFHFLCEFLWQVGCRPSEAAGLTAEGIDWATGTATLKQHKTKHKGRRRVLYLSTESLVLLRRQADRYKTGPLFRGLGGKPLTRHAIVCRFIRISEKIGKTVRAYDYRHTYITRALSQGVPDTHVAALVGHANTNMLHKFYSHVGRNADLLRDTANKVA